jgi:hypothetical protein
MASDDSQPSDLFLGLVVSLQASAWMLLGKVVNPMTGKIDRNLDQAKETIDLLGMLEEKTRGNLQADEQRLLGQVLYQLRMNYVEEIAAPGEASPGSTAARDETGPPPS